MKVYLAGPLFSTAEKNFNAELAAQLRKAGHQVFLPQEQPVVQSGGSTKAILISCLSGIAWCDVVVANLDGPDPDSGTCWELGFAYAKNKQSLAFRTDVRVHEGFDKINLMMTDTVDQMLYRPGDNVVELAGRLDYWINRQGAERERDDRGRKD